MILHDGSKRKEQSYRESFPILREYLGNHAQNVDGNIGSKVHSDEVSDGNEEHVIDTGRKAILVIKRQRAWVNCVHVFCGK